MLLLFGRLQPSAFSESREFFNAPLSANVQRLLIGSHIQTGRSLQILCVLSLGSKRRCTLMMMNASSYLC